MAMMGGCRHYSFQRPGGPTCALGHSLDSPGAPIKMCYRREITCPDWTAWTPEETAAEERGWREVIETVFPFAERLKAKMVVNGQVVKSRVRTRCPWPGHKSQTELHWIHARIDGPRRHMHMACDDPACPYRMME